MLPVIISLNSVFCRVSFVKGMCFLKWANRLKPSSSFTVAWSSILILPLQKIRLRRWLFQKSCLMNRSYTAKHFSGDRIIPYRIILSDSVSREHVLLKNINECFNDTLTDSYADPGSRGHGCTRRSSTDPACCVWVLARSLSYHQLCKPLVSRWSALLPQQHWRSKWSRAGEVFTHSTNAVV